MAAEIHTESFGRIKTMETDKNGTTHNVTHLVLFGMRSVVHQGKVVDLQTQNVKYRTVKHG